MEPHLLIAAQLYATTAVQTGFIYLSIQYCFIAIPLVRLWKIVWKYF